MEKYTERLGTAPLGPLLIRLSLPGIAATIAGSLYNIVDTFWVARLGHEAIAALTIVFPYQILAMAVGMGTGTGIGALVSRYFGEKNIKGVNLAAGQIFFLSVVWGLLFLIPPLFMLIQYSAFSGPQIISWIWGGYTWLLPHSGRLPMSLYFWLAALSAGQETQ
jgi:Na+-driven multidrug efflux pump